tara:strand:- start:144 stop:698 length:555 start_codon:yes stop_codon:yes gene_type:complete
MPVKGKLKPKKPKKPKKPIKRRRPKQQQVNTYIAPKSLQYGQFAEGWIPYMHKMTFEPIPSNSTFASTTKPFLQEQRQPIAPTLRDMQAQASPVSKSTQASPVSKSTQTPDLPADDEYDEGETAEDVIRWFYENEGIAPTDRRSPLPRMTESFSYNLYQYTRASPVPKRAMKYLYKKLTTLERV